jgi:hypothetical protein
MLPGNVLSTTPEPAVFLLPRTGIRFSAASGLSDISFGGIALGDPSAGIIYQLWTAFIQNGSIWLSAPNTPPFVLLPGVGAVWVALAFDQNARVFVAYSLANGSSFYYWYDSLVSGYVTSALPGFVPRVFAALDDVRPAEASSADVILAYVRAGELYFRAQRDRFEVEYDLGPSPATLVQIGMNHGNRFQFAFQNVQGSHSVPPAEFSPGAI